LTWRPENCSPGLQKVDLADKLMSNCLRILQADAVTVTLMSNFLLGDR
jgi:hypothetical protein